MLFLRLFDLRLFGFVCFLFLLVSENGCGLCLWHSLDFSLTFLVIPECTLIPTIINVAYINYNSWEMNLSIMAAVRVDANVDG